MRWCLRVKLAQNWQNFAELLLTTEECPIVEESGKNDFWGAKPLENGTLVGRNVLGRLLMELREELHGTNRVMLKKVEPLNIPSSPLREIDRCCRSSSLGGTLGS